MSLKVKYLLPAAIELKAQGLLEEYGRRFGRVTEPPIPIDDVLENHLGLTLNVGDLRGMLGWKSECDDGDLLGAITMAGREVYVDQSLDPVEHVGIEGRYRFTLGHEIGHWMLHRAYYRNHPSPLRLHRKGNISPDLICRTTGQSQPVEWQASRFAACLLMPKQMVLDAWKARYGNLQPILPLCLKERTPGTESERSATTRTSFHDIEESFPNEILPLYFAEDFNVSTQAMRVRLETLELLADQRTQRRLAEQRAAGGALRP